MPTGELNRFIEKITTASPPVTSGKRNVRVMYASQTSVAPPTFVLFTNAEAKLHFSYERFLENRLRESYGFFGKPIRIQVRGRPDSRRRGAQDRRRARARAAQAGEKGAGLEADANADAREAAQRASRGLRSAQPSRREATRGRRERSGRGAGSSELESDGYTA